VPGPSPKLAYIWDIEDFESEFGETAKKIPHFTIDEDRTKSRKYILQKEDGIYIPKGSYHALSSNGFSITLGIAPYLLNSKKMIDCAMSRLIKKADYKHNSIVTYGDEETEFENIISNSSSITKLINSFDLSKSIEAEYLLLKSNNYLKDIPIPRYNLTVEFQREYQLKSGSKIEKSIIAGRLYLFFNGVEVSFVMFDSLEKMIHHINDSRKFSVECIYLILDQALSVNSIEIVLNVLLQYGVIEHA
jgi:hypothetical protein